MQSLLPSAEALELRELFVQKLQRIVDTEWPGRDITVHLFGYLLRLMLVRP